MFVTVLVVVFIHKGARRVPIQYARLTRGSERAPGAPARWSGAVSLSLPS